MSAHQSHDPKVQSTFKLNLQSKMHTFNTLVQETLRITKNKSESKGKSFIHTHLFR